MKEKAGRGGVIRYDFSGSQKKPVFLASKIVGAILEAKKTGFLFFCCLPGKCEHNPSIILTPSKDEKFVLQPNKTTSPLKTGMGGGVSINLILRAQFPEHKVEHN